MSRDHIYARTLAISGDGRTTCKQTRNGHPVLRCITWLSLVLVGHLEVEDAVSLVNKNHWAMGQLPVSGFIECTDSIGRRQHPVSVATVEL